MKIVFVDQGNYAFVRSAAAAMLGGGAEVLYLYASAAESRYRPAVPSGTALGRVPAIAVGARGELHRSDLVRRAIQERMLAKAFTSLVDQAQPTFVIGANNALPIQKALLQWCLRHDRKFVFWLQDLRGLAAREILGRRFGVAGRIVGHFHMLQERALIQRSHHTIALTDAFRKFALASGAKPSHVSVLSNWAVVEEQPLYPKANRWSTTAQIDNTFNFVYSGLLGLKQNPDVLLSLAKEFRNDTSVRLLVIAEGPGAAYVKGQAKYLGLSNVIVRPFLADTRELPLVLASADVLVATLESASTEYCVPSKILTYLCAGRPILMSGPPDNTAMKLIRESGFGVATCASAESEFLEAARLLRSSAEVRARMGQAGRLYAEREFNQARIARRFGQILSEAPLLRQSAALAPSAD
jgi:colanic acid biosynthesis glycosyl transferase WcaI